MTAYKFLNLPHVDNMLKGNIQFRSARSFRMMENALGDDCIGDVNESSRTMIVDHLALSGSNPANVQTAARLGINLAPGDRIYMEQNRYTNFVECYIFSFSVGNLQEIVSGLISQSNGTFTYAGCVAISDPMRLTALIRNRGIIGGERIFSNYYVECYPVSYVYDEHQMFNHALPEQASPFTKWRKYAYQKEWRIVLRPRRKVQLPSEPQIVKIGQAIGLFSSVPLSGYPIPASSTWPSHDEAMRELFVLLPKWKISIGSEGGDGLDENGTTKVFRLYWILRDKYQDSTLDQLLETRDRFLPHIGHTRRFLAFVEREGAGS